MYPSLLAEISTLSDHLQAPGLDLSAAVDLIQVVHKRLSDLRSDEEFDKIWNESAGIAERNGINQVRSRPKRASKISTRLQESVITESIGQRQDFTDKIQFKEHVYFAILDAMMGEMNRRFSDTNCSIMSGIQSLSPQCNAFLQLEVVRPFAISYECNLDDLKHELHQAGRLIDRKREAGCEPPKSILEFTCFLEPYKDAFHELYRLCKIAITLPVSSASCERSFSALKRIKTYLRNSMTDSRLSDLGILSIESERAKSLNMSTFVDVFASRHNNRRINLC